jgi:hypothetical protein
MKISYKIFPKPNYENKIKKQNKQNKNKRGLIILIALVTNRTKW